MVSSAFIAAAGLISITAFLVGLSQGRVSRAMLSATNEQPSAHADIRRAGIIATVLIEGSVIMAGIGALFCLLGRETYTNGQIIGAFFALVIPAITAGYASISPASEGLRSIARQPHTAGRITTILLITLTVIQTPVILGLITALLIFARQPLSTAHSIAYGAAGFAVGVGSVGPLLGLRRFTGAVCHALGYNPQAYTPLFPFLFIGQALIETPSLLALIVGLLLIIVPPGADTATAAIIALTAGITTGLVTLMPGLASGKTAASACIQIEKYPEKSRHLMQLSIITQTFIDTAALYGIGTALMLILTSL